MLFMYLGYVGVGIAIPAAIDAACFASHHYRHTRMMSTLKQLDDSIKSDTEQLLVQLTQVKTESAQAAAKQGIVESKLRTVQDQNRQHGAALADAELTNHKIKLREIASLRS